MLVRECLRSAPVTVPPGCTLEEAGRLMGSHGVGSLLVVDGDRLVGIVTDRDITVRGIGEGRPPTADVGSVMTADPVTIQGSADVFEAFKVFKTATARRLPVLEDEDLAGIISVDDLLSRWWSSSAAVMSPVAQELRPPGLSALSWCGAPGARSRRPSATGEQRPRSAAPPAAPRPPSADPITRPSVPLRRWRAPSTNSGMLASRVATPPTASASRGLVTSLRYPRKGAPMGVLPEEGDGVERHHPAPHGRVGPQLQGGVVGGHEGDAGRPHGTSRTMAQVCVGESATARMAPPKTTPMKASSRVDGRLRNAVTRPPATAPAPMATRNQL